MLPHINPMVTPRGTLIHLEAAVSVSGIWTRWLAVLLAKDFAAASKDSKWATNPSKIANLQ